MKTKVRVSLVFVIILSLVLQSFGAFADHPYSPKRHISSTHDDSVDEYFCGDVKESSLSLSTFIDDIKDILYLRNYDGLANDKIYFLNISSSNHCSDLSSSILSNTQLRYYVESNTSPRCDGTSSCIVRYGSSPQSDGHTHYDYAVITIREGTWNNVPDYITNHETGHFLGLIDGDGTCPGSIMHSADYGCSNGYPSDPYQADLDTVEAEANSN